MAIRDLTSFLWDEENERKVQAHGLSPNDIDDVLGTESFAVFENRRGLPGSYQVVGRDFNGRWVTVIVQPTAFSPGVWRPRTAWPSKRGEITKARRQGVR